MDLFSKVKNASLKVAQQGSLHFLLFPSFFSSFSFSFTLFLSLSSPLSYSLIHSNLIYFLGFSLIQTVTTTVVHDIGITTAFVPKKPVDDFLSRFQLVLQLLDQLASMENSNSAEAERLLNDSKVRDHIREMLKHLQHEDELWIQSHGEKIDDEIAALNFFGIGFSNNFV